MRKEKENHQSRPLSGNKKYHSFSGEVSYWSSPGHLKACSVSLHDKHSSKRNFLAFWLRKNWRKNKTLIEQGLMGGGGEGGVAGGCLHVNPLILKNLFAENQGSCLVQHCIID